MGARKFCYNKKSTANFGAMRMGKNRILLIINIFDFCYIICYNKCYNICYNKTTNKTLTKFAAQNNGY